MLMWEDVARAIRRASDNLMDYEDALEVADRIMGFFGYEDRIIDNILYPRDRDVFYQLENMGLLKTVHEETTLPDGRDWRVHYWLLNVKKEEEEETVETSTELKGSVYDELPAEIWKARAS